MRDSRMNRQEMNRLFGIWGREDKVKADSTQSGPSRLGAKALRALRKVQRQSRKAQGGTTFKNSAGGRRGSGRRK